MKIAAFVASPHPKGSVNQLVDAFAEGARTKGHAVSVFQLYDLKINPCRACDYCKTHADRCAQADDFLMTCTPAIEASDICLFASPIYFGQVSGTMKNFIDRWCMYFNDKFSIRRVMGKRFVTITASAAPATRFVNVTDYLKYWFGEFFKMQHVGGIIAGDLSHESKLKEQPELLDQARQLGVRLG